MCRGVMDKVITEYNRLCPKYKALPCEGTCEITEPNPRNASDFRLLRISDCNGYVFDRELASASTSFYTKAESPALMKANCDGIFLSNFEGRNCLFCCELKSGFSTEDIFKAREQILGTLVRLRSIFSALKESVVWEFHGIIVSYEPKEEQLVALSKLTNNEARFAQSIYSNKHKNIKGDKAAPFYPVAIPDICIHYVGVPRKKPEYVLPLQAIVGL